MSILYTASVVLHLTAVLIWIGGTLFIALVLFPVVRRLQPPDLGSRIVREVGLRFRLVGWACIGVILVTGLVNLLAHGIPFGHLFTWAFWTTTFGRTLAVKLSLVVAVLLLSIFHDFVLGPRAARLAREGNPAARGVRRAVNILARVNVILMVAIVAAAVVLVRGLPRA